MRTIYKYRLPRDGQSIVIEERIIETLHIGKQDGWPMLWAVVEPDEYEETEIVAWGTGWPLPDDVYFETDYVGTCEDAAGYVWHYFAATRSAYSSARSYVDYNTLKTSASDKNYTQTITVSCDHGPIDNFMCVDKLTYDPTISTACTGTISSNAYDNNVKVDLERLLGMIEKYASDPNTATNGAYR